MTSARVLIVTPQLRRYRRALLSQYALIDAAPCPVEWLILPHPSGAPQDARNVLTAWQTATKRVRDGNFTHLLTLEDDMVVPPDGLAKLLALDVPVAYGLYVWRRKPYYWSAYRTLALDNGASWQYDQPHTAAQMLRNAAPVETMGLGNGLTLIRREVLDMIPWRMHEGRAAPDWWFANDCNAAGIGQVHHFGVVCGHISMSPAARVLWPSINQHDRATAWEQRFDVDYDAAPDRPWESWQMEIEE